MYHFHLKGEVSKNGDVKAFVLEFTYFEDLDRFGMCFEVGR
jgi:hypothetical protein